MPAKKRNLDDEPTTQKQKKAKLAKEEKKSVAAPIPPSSNLVADEVDFPRGGGTSFTALEVKSIRAEAVKEANDELFEV